MSLHASDPEEKDAVQDAVDEKSSGIQCNVEAVSQKDDEDIVEFEEKKDLKFVLSSVCWLSLVSDYRIVTGVV